MKQVWVWTATDGMLAWVDSRRDIDNNLSRGLRGLPPRSSLAKLLRLNEALKDGTRGFPGGITLYQPVLKNQFVTSKEYEGRNPTSGRQMTYRRVLERQRKYLRD